MWFISYISICNVKFETCKTKLREGSMNLIAWNEYPWDSTSSWRIFLEKYRSAVYGANNKIPLELSGNKSQKKASPAQVNKTRIVIIEAVQA
jgi:hypothetical protein